MTPGLPKALFLDRDGTLIVDRHYLADPAEVELVAGAKETLHQFLAEGCRLFLFTNQSGVGRGMFDLATVQRCNDRMLELLALPPPGFTDLCIATETPDERAVYRKPSPRFILEMIAKYTLAPADVWMIGDRLNDVQAGLNAGVRTAMIAPERPADLPAGVWHCRSLGEFRERVRASTV